MSWRLILKAMGEFNFSCIFAPVQIAGIAALQGGEAFIQASIERYKAALDTIVERFAEFPRVKFPIPHAAFYAFFAVDGVDDSYAFAERALLETGVGLAPGLAFGPEGEGYLRVCFAANVETIHSAIDRLAPLLR